jgi:LysM repeat protein
VKKGMRWVSKGLLAGMLIAASAGSGLANAQIKTDMEVNGSHTQIIVDLGQGALSTPVQLTFVHIVKPGETLWGIAHHYGVTVNEVRNHNKLNVGKGLSVSQRLLIQVASSKKSGDQQKYATFYMLLDQKTAVPKISQLVKGKTHVIQKGETLYSVARLYGITVQELAKNNSIKVVDYIVAGNRLQIPYQSYTVAAGDTLNQIAKKYNTTVKKISAYNGLNPNVAILIGQRIKIPS